MTRTSECPYLSILSILDASDHFDKRFPGSKALHDFREKRFEPVSQLRVRRIAEAYPHDRSRFVTERREGGKVFILRDNNESVPAGKLKDSAIIER